MDGSGFGPNCAKTTCPYCGVGCGVRVEKGKDRAIKVKGDDSHPANRGRLCSKGTALSDTTTLKGRMVSPKIRTNEGFETISPEAAVTEVAKRFIACIDTYGPDSVAFYVSGQLLTEDYYAVNKLAKGFIGTANIDTNSRLCMASAVAAHKSVFGADLVPAVYEDIFKADCLVFSGHNAAWTHPVLYRQLEGRTDQYRIVIDPKRTETAMMADLHLMIRPQSDVRLWQGLCVYLIRHKFIDQAYVEAHTEGYEAFKTALLDRDQSLRAIARDCDISLKDLKIFYEKFAQTSKVVSLFSMGSNQSTQGVSKGLSLIYAHLLTGKIGREGAAPFSITGQPNAMGGREVGGLANMLAAHMDFDVASKERVKRFWASPTIAEKAGLKAVDMFKAIHDGRIKAVWIMATNPVVSLPDAHFIREALRRCETVVVSDVVEKNDTLDSAHVKLPALAWGEKDGTVTNSERVISRQKAFLSAPEGAKPDWQWVADVARAMNADWTKGFVWDGPHAVFDEYARQTAFENDGQRVFNLEGLVGLSKPLYDSLRPIRWPVTKDGKGATRLFADGRFATPSGRARFTVFEADAPIAPTETYPLSLNASRLRDQWHTMTRTATCVALNAHSPEPILEVHPDTAKAFGIQEARLAKVITAFGVSVFRARLTETVRRDSLMVPMHFTGQFTSHGASNGLISPRTDPISGQPEFKHTPAIIEAYNEQWHGYILAKDDEFDTKNWPTDWVWRKMNFANYWVYEVAGKTAFSPESLSEKTLTLSLKDANRGLWRGALLGNGDLEMVFYVDAIAHALPPKTWITRLFAEGVDADALKLILLGQKPGLKDLGPQICACKGVCRNTILDAVKAGATSVEKVGEKTSAGTQCGSCKPEIARLLKSAEVSADTALTAT